MNGARAPTAALRTLPRLSGQHAGVLPRGAVAFPILDTEWPAVRRSLQSRLEARS